MLYIIFDMRELIYNIIEAALAGFGAVLASALVLFFVALITNQHYLIEPPIIKYAIYGTGSVTFFIYLIYLQYNAHK